MRRREFLWTSGAVLTGLAVAPAKAAALASAAARPSALPLNARVVDLGHSFTALGYNLGSVFSGWDCQGYAGWLRVNEGIGLASPPAQLTQLAPIRGGNLGHRGDTVEMIANRVRDAVALKPALTVLTAGSNDLFPVQHTADELLASFDAIVTALRAAQSRIAIFTVPIAGGAAAWSAPSEALRSALNAALKSRAAPDLLVVDLDPVLTAGGDFEPNDIHPSNRGAAKMGLALRQALAAAGWLPDAKAAEAQWTGRSSLTRNPTLSGDNGGFARGWSVDGSSAGGGTLTGSKAGSARQTLVFGGAKSGTDRFLALGEYQKTRPGSPGAIVEPFIRFSIVKPLLNISAIGTKALFFDADFKLILATTTLQSSLQEPLPLDLGEYAFRGPATVLPPEKADACYTTIFIQTMDGDLPLSGTIEVSLSGVRQVT